MRHFVLAIAVALFCSPPSSGQELIPVEAFAHEPGLQHAVLSPGGSKIAFTTVADGVNVLVVRDLSDGSIQIANVTDLRTEGLRWAGDNFLLLITSKVADNTEVRGSIDFRGIIAFVLDEDMRSHQLLHRRSSHIGFNSDLADIIGIEPGTNRVILPVRDADGTHDLVSVDPASGRMSIVGRGNIRTRDWIADHTGRAVVRLDYSQRRDREVIRVRDGDGWQTISDERDIDRPSFTMHGLLPDGRLAVSTTAIYEDQDSRASLYTISLETGDFEDVVFSHDRYDLSRVIMDPYSNQVLGVAWQENMERYEWFDEEMNRHQGIIDATLSGQNPRIQSWSQNRDKYLIVTERENTPPVYYIYDTQTPSIGSIGAAYQAISSGQLRPRNLTAYTASDGTRIEAYLTLPEGEGPFPSVLLPHGGPTSRDTGGYDYFAHFLASRGYAVLQPNFRGSSGYGHDWKEAGYGQWGRGVMQTDVTDGTTYLINEGIAAPDRICIVGASYGGYSALAGAAFTPDLYACSAAIAPVADLDEMVDYSRDRFGPWHWFVESWRERMTGDRDNRDVALLDDLSPITHVEDISIPILLIHGEEDTVVPVAQSRQMNRALRRVGADVEYVELEDGDHWLTSAEMRTTVLTELEQFLDEHIGD